MAATVIVAATLLSGAPGCGEDESDEDRIAEVVSGLHDDLRHGRLSEVCAALAPRPRVEVGSVGHRRRPTTCEADLREFVPSTERPAGFSEAVPGLADARRPRIVSVEVAEDGRRAEVAMTLGGDAYSVPFVEQDGDWKLADFFGATGPVPKGLR